MPPNVDTSRVYTFQKWTEYWAESGADSLFHALGWLFERHHVGVSDPAKLRRYAAEQIEWYWETRPVLERPEHLSEYLTGLKEGYIFGDHTCAAALAVAFGVKIIIHSRGQDAMPFGAGLPELHVNCRPPRKHGQVYQYNPLVHQSEIVKPKPVDMGVKGGTGKSVGSSRSSKQRAVRLQRGNTLEETSCACKVKPMAADPYIAEVVGTNGASIGTAKIPYCIYPHLKKGKFGFVSIPPSTEAMVVGFILESPVGDGPMKGARPDWYAGSCIKSGRLLASDDPSCNELFRYEEQCYYAQRALFAPGVAGCVGQIEVLALGAGATAKLTKPLPRVDDKGAEEVILQVHDGWGYIKQCLVKHLGSPKARLLDPLALEEKDEKEKDEKKEQKGEKKEQKMAESFVDLDPIDEESIEVELGVGSKVHLRQPRAHYQMFQWLRTTSTKDEEEEDLVVAELAELALRDGGLLIDATMLPSWAAPLVKANLELLEHPLIAVLAQRGYAQRAYMRVLTADPPLAHGVAMPVASGAVVIPATSRFTSFDVKSGKLAVFRFPADTLNWTCVESVDQESALAGFISKMEAIQYSLVGRADGADVFYKGMLGVVPDELWPEEWNAHALVVCHKDAKASSAWTSPVRAEVMKSSPFPTSFCLRDAGLEVTQWFEPGTCIGVPYAVQEQLAGDYDGDLAVLLSADMLPATHAYIARKSASRPANPKLDKTLTPLAPEDSRKACIKKIYEGGSLVGTWTNLSSHLLALDEETLTQLASGTKYGTKEALLLRVSKGIKEGTDAFKTKVDISVSADEASTLRKALAKANLLAPHVLAKKEPGSLWTQSAPEKPYGIPSKLLYSMRESVKPNLDITPKKASKYAQYAPKVKGDEGLVVEMIRGWYTTITELPAAAARAAYEAHWRDKLHALISKDLPRGRVAELTWLAIHDDDVLGTSPEHELAFRLFVEELAAEVDTLVRKMPGLDEEDIDEDVVL